MKQNTAKNITVITDAENASTSLTEAVIAQTRHHAQQAAQHISASVEHALLAGLRIFWLHSKKPLEHGGDRRSQNFNVPRGTLKSFEQIIKEVGIPLRTAYRWLHAFRTCYIRRFGMAEDESVPEPGTPEFAALEEKLRQVARTTTSLRRLMLGASAYSSEELRYHELIDVAETGSHIAEQILERVESGQLSLEAAVKALGGAQATKDKPRRAPVYFQTNLEGQLEGLFVKAITTLKTGFLCEFPTLDTDLRLIVIKKWKDLVTQIREIIEQVEQGTPPSTQ